MVIDVAHRAVPHAGVQASNERTRVLRDPIQFLRQRSAMKDEIELSRLPVLFCRPPAQTLGHMVKPRRAETEQILLLVLRPKLQHEKFV